jgi:hypothetical protein
VRFNRAEPNVFAAAAHDRSLVLFDTRARTPLRKLITKACVAVRMVAAVADGCG